MSILKKFKDFLLEYIDIMIFAILVPLKLTKFSQQIYNLEFADVADPAAFPFAQVLVPALASVLLLLAISMLFKRSRSRSRFLFVSNLVLTFVLICDLTYYNYFKDMISIPVLVNGLQLGAVNTSVGTVFDKYSLRYGIDLVTVYPFAMVLKMLLMKTYKAPYTLKRRVISFTCVLAVSFAINAAYIYKMQLYPIDTLTTLYSRVNVATKLGDLDYHYLDAYSTVKSSMARIVPVSQAKQAEIKTALQSNSSVSAKYYGKYKGKNVIVIQVEALQQFVIGRSYNGEEITPNLNKWISRSMYFDNYYTQVSSGMTSDAEFVSNNSLYPADAGSAYYLYAGNKFTSLSNEMHDNGYYTAALHAYKESFWNRNVMYKALGFDDFFSQKSYEFNYSVGLGLNDRSFLLQSLDKMKVMKEPYYSFIITLSSHFPFDDIYKYGDFDPGEYKGTLLGRYLQAIHYEDEQLGVFLDEMERQGITKDAVIVMYGDHYAIPKDGSDQLYDLLGITNPTDVDYIETQKVPLIIHVPDESLKGVNHTLSGQIDFYPTISNLMGIKAENIMGQDILNSTSDKIIFRNGSFITNTAYYNSLKNIYYDLKTEKAIQPTTELLDQKADVVTRLNYSDTVLKHNLLKVIN